MKTFREFFMLKEGGMWENPGIPDNNGRGNKRQGIAWQKDLYNSRYDGTNAGGGVAMPQTSQGQMPKKAMKKK